VSGAGKGIRGASLAHALLFPSCSLPFPPGLSTEQGARLIDSEGAEGAEGGACLRPLKKHTAHPARGGHLQD